MLQFVQSTLHVSEAASSVAIPLTIASPTGATPAAEAFFTVYDQYGTAVYYGDYGSINAEHNLADVLAQSVRMRIDQDMLVEGDESFTLHLVAGDGVEIGAISTLTVTIKSA